MSEQGKTIFREELYEAVWQTPISKLAAAWNVQPVNIVKACERMNVPRPEAGHRAMVRRGWEVTKEALPAAVPGTPTSTTIGTRRQRGRRDRRRALSAAFSERVHGCDRPGSFTAENEGPAGEGQQGADRSCAANCGRDHQGSRGKRGKARDGARIRHQGDPDRW